MGGHRARFYTPVFKTGRIMVYECQKNTDHKRVLSLQRDIRKIVLKSRTIWWIKSHNSGMKNQNFTKKYTNRKTINSNNCAKFEVNWPRFKLRTVIGIDSLAVCILFGEISIFHSRVMGLYSSNCRRFFVCHAVNWEPLRQFISNFILLLEFIVERMIRPSSTFIQYL
jgi:hypothetical protein